jgi:uncharacterized protein YdhG (YjbR/CyaY superfamily)
MKNYKDIDSYIASFPKKVQMTLKKLRSTIKKVIPVSEETISYGIPSFSVNDSYVAHFGGFEKHVSLFPGGAAPIEAFKKELVSYKTGRGTIQFPLDTKIPYGLISRIVKYSLKHSLDKVRQKANSKGVHVEFHPNGVIWAKGKVKDRKMEGYWEWFRKNGVILRSGYFKKGVQTGKWTTYDKAGKAYKVTQK